MNILYIHQYFVTPNEPGGTRSYWISQELIKKGHKVVMLTSSSKINEKVKQINIDGIDVIYIKEKYEQNMSVMRRLIAFVNFMIKAIFYGFKQKDIDLVIATSTPLTIGIPALLFKWFKKIPFIFEVRDLWPEVPIQMGAIKNKFFIACSRWIEKIIYKNSEHIIALSPGMQDGVIKYVPKNKTTVIPNMAKIDEFFPREKNYQMIEELGLKKETFKIIHFGSLGIANGAQYIVESAKLLSQTEDVEFVFLGGGSTEKTLVDAVKNYELRNVKFLGSFPMKQTAQIVNLCDVSIVSFLDLPILYTNSPNKLFDSLSAGKPIIVNSAGWTKDLVEDNECGYYVNPKHPEELVEKILYLKRNSEIIKRFGSNSRYLAENQYDKKILCKKFVDLIEAKYV